ncbi:CHAT domain-containing tetratricopeptide repeat protein [Thermocatellispora tengchongensis]|uniref:CHAT domain-containing tetratricopeptide repeat protein n=1 Tax=Thermocatellispora tengchongensis TaxID=1073253 RepID=UPI00362CB44E
MPGPAQPVRTGAGGDDDLTAAVEAGWRALRLEPDGPLRPSRLSNLSRALRMRYGRTGADEDLDQALATAEEAVAASAGDVVNLDGYLSNLAIAQLDHYGRTGTAADLDTALRTARRAVSATPGGHPARRAGRLANLANTLLAAARSRGAADLGEAVEVSRLALDSTPEGHPDRIMHLLNLAGALRAAYDATGSLAELLEAGELAEQADALVPGGHPLRGIASYTLGAVAQTLAVRGGAAHGREQAAAHAQRAVTALRAAVAAFPPGHRMRPAALDGLANALQILSWLTADPAALTEAVETGRAALRETPVGDPARPGRLCNLSIAARSLHESTWLPEAVHEAARLAGEAVAATAADEPEHAVAQFLLGEALYGGRPDLRDPAGFEDVLDAYRRASAVPTGAPVVRAHAAAAWGRLAAVLGDHREALRGLTTAVELLELVVPAAMGLPDQEHRLAGFPDFTGVASDAAACALALGGAGLALELLERGRGLLIGHALDTRVDLAALERRAPELAARFGELCRSLDRARATAPDLPTGRLLAPAVRSATVAGLRARYEELTRLLAEIRRIRGFGRFMDRPDVEELKAAAAGGAVIVINVSDFGSHALIVTPRAVTATPLEDLHPAAVRGKVRLFSEALREGRPGTADEDTIHDVLEWLWDTIAQTVLKRLREHGPIRRVWWSATGPLALLPLHAAGRRGEPGVLDEVVSSYTPTLSALARVPAPPAGDGPPRGLVVSMPRTPRHRPLPGAAAAPGLMRSVCPGATDELTGPAATREAVLNALPGHRYVHLACHAYTDPARPSRSRLVLHDHARAPLTVADVLGLHAGGELAFLSACGTARTGAELADEGIHLVSAFQLAGYRHVVGTLWTVADRHTVRVDSHVYRALRESGDPGRVPLALHEAVLEQRRRWPDHPSVWACHTHSGAGGT